LIPEQSLLTATAPGSILASAIFDSPFRKEIVHFNI